MPIYTVKLTDGTTFVGKRGWNETLQEGWQIMRFHVINSAVIPVGRLILVPVVNVVYAIKEPKAKK